MRSKSASLLNAFAKLGGAAPNLIGIMAVFDESNANCRSDT
jgi:hypothetical protein